MAKRFTDTEKWNDPWYRKLPVIYKKFFDYLCDRCDNAGMWKVDMELAEFHLGTQLNKDEAVVLFDGRIRPMDEKYWYIPGFVSFQFGELSEDSRPHKSIIELIKKYRVSKGYKLRVQDTLKDKDKDSGKDKDNTVATESNFNALWDLYPNKDGRKMAFKHFQGSVFTPEDLTDLQTAIKNYINYVRGKDPKYIKSGATFFNNWRDWINWKPSTTTDGIPAWMK